MDLLVVAMSRPVESIKSNSRLRYNYLPINVTQIRRLGKLIASQVTFSQTQYCTLNLQSFTPKLYKRQEARKH